MMTEDFLHFIWKYGLFERNDMLADTGESVHIISLGEQNHDAGPDFINSRIQIGDTIWAGSVEIHVQSSDWADHGHQTDKAYNNVILHVSHKHNKPVRRFSGEQIPGIELHFNSDLFSHYTSLLLQKEDLICRKRMTLMDPVQLSIWLHSLAIERLQQKTIYLKGLLMQSKSNWEEVFFIHMARSFGFGLNAAPFELTSRSIPWQHFSRHHGSLLQMEALLFGQAGFLELTGSNSLYYQKLQREYSHLKRLYNLKPIERHLWKFLRIRPVNFPTIRLSQFAALFNQSQGLFARIIECKDLPAIQQYFKIQASPFWEQHYTFDTSSPQGNKSLGDSSFHSLMINAIVPMFFLYGQAKDLSEYRERALEWLTALPAEDNRITRRWTEAGVKIEHALESQALLHLSASYCSKKRCLTCAVGARVIFSAAN